MSSAIILRRHLPQDLAGNVVYYVLIYSDVIITRDENGGEFHKSGSYLDMTNQIEK